MPKTHCRLFQIGDDDIREHSTIIEPNASSSSFSEFYKIWKKCHFWRSCIDYQMLKYIWLLLVFFPYHGYSWLERSKYISMSKKIIDFIALQLHICTQIFVHCTIFKILEYCTSPCSSQLNCLSEMRGPSSSTQVSAYLPDWKNDLEFHYYYF